MRSLIRAAARMLYRAPGEATACPACGSARLFDLDLLVLKQGGQGSRTGFICGCDDCGLVFSNPQASSEELARFYSPEGEWGAPRSVEPVRDPAVRRTLGSWTSMFDPIRHELSVTAPPSGSRVFDFGCGNGDLLDALQDIGWETWGLETAVDHAFRRHRRLEAVPADGSFDLIIASHVLEHVPDPLALLRRFAAASRMGGFLLISTPRLDTLPLHRDYKYVINGRAHVTAYTWPCLEGLLARAGWSAVAPPPAHVSKGGGRRTRARLRVLARRVDGAIGRRVSPGDAARSAVRGYYAHGDTRPIEARLGFLRLAARRAEARRRRDVHTRNAAKRGATAW